MAKEYNKSSVDHVAELSFNQDFNIGLYAFTTDKFCLVGPNVSKKNIEIIEKVLDVPVHVITIAGTDMIGVFVSGNEDCLLLPSIVFKDELEALDKLEIKYEIIKSRITALGNTIACNKNGIFVSEEFSADNKKRIRTALNLPLKPGQISELSNVGSCLVVTDKGALIHRDAAEFEIDFASDIFGVDIIAGSVNLGSPYVKSGIIANSKGFLIGSNSSGVEINNIDKALGFLDY